MRKLYERYYTVKLADDTRSQFATEELLIDKEFDTYEEAEAYGKKESLKYTWVSPATGNVCECYYVVVTEHYREVTDIYRKNEE